MNRRLLHRPLTRRTVVAGLPLAAAGLALMGIAPRRIATQDGTPAASPPASPAAASPVASPTTGATREETALATITGIDTTAPVVARHEIEIAAPLDVVWGLHTDIPAWPTWNPDITDVALEQPLAPGASFRWTTAGLAVRSTVYAVTDRSRTLWGGPASGIVGIPEWTFVETADGVRVNTNESWSGAPVEADVAGLQEALDGSLVAWLRHLKVAAEARA